MVAKTRFSVALDEQEYAELAAMAEKHRVSMAWLVRHAVTDSRTAPARAIAAPVTSDRRAIRTIQRLNQEPYISMSRSGLPSGSEFSAAKKDGSDNLPPRRVVAKMPLSMGSPARLVTPWTSRNSTFRERSPLKQATLRPSTRRRWDKSSMGTVSMSLRATQTLPLTSS